jgi:YVTN family beta-propeller protein
MNTLRLLPALVLMSLIAIAQELPKPALLVLAKNQASLVIVDPTAMKVVGKIPTGVGPHELTVSADGTRAFVANYGEKSPGSTLSVIDLAARTEKKVELGALKRPHGIIQRNGKIYFSSELSKVIASLDPVTLTVDWIQGTGQNITHMICSPPDGKKFFTANILSDSVSAIEQAQIPGGWKVTTIPVGKGPEAIDISPDGKEVWTAHSGDGGVSIIDTATLKVTQTLPALTKHSNRLKFTPDGKQVLISDPEGHEVVVLDGATGKELKRVKIGGLPLGIQMAPDGSRAFIALADEGAVVAIDLKTLEIAGRVATGEGSDGMAWAN